MKISKTLIKVTGLALAMGIALAPLSADAGRFRGANAGSGAGAYLVDTDGDGIGDTRPTRGTGQGANVAKFVDLNKDGICDTFEDGSQQLLDGSGSRR